MANESDQQLLVYFRDLLPGIINAVGLSVQQQTDDMLLKCLIDVAENVPKYLRPQIEAILDLAIKVAQPSLSFRPYRVINFTPNLYPLLMCCFRRLF